jgi:hypothetical protein
MSAELRTSPSLFFIRREDGTQRTAMLKIFISTWEAALDNQLRMFA